LDEQGRTARLEGPRGRAHESLSKGFGHRRSFYRHRRLLGTRGGRGHRGSARLPHLFRSGARNVTVILTLFAEDVTAFFARHFVVRPKRNFWPGPGRRHGGGAPTAPEGDPGRPSPAFRMSFAARLFFRRRGLDFPWKAMHGEGGGAVRGRGLTVPRPTGGRFVRHLVKHGSPAVTEGTRPQGGPRHATAVRVVGSGALRRLTGAAARLAPCRFEHRTFPWSFLFNAPARLKRGAPFPGRRLHEGELL